MIRRGRVIWFSGKKLCAAMLLIALLLSFAAMADIKIEGWRNQNYDYIITDMKDFPDYVFLTSSAIWGWEYASRINSTGSFGGGYKLDSFVVHAIKASDFSRYKFYTNRYDYEPETVNCTEYCQDSPKIVSSNLTLPKSISVEEIIPLKKIEVYLKVDSITSQSLNISKIKMLYYYENGTVQEHPVDEV